MDVQLAEDAVELRAYRVRTAVQFVAHGFQLRVSAAQPKHDLQLRVGQAAQELARFIAGSPLQLLHVPGVINVVDIQFGDNFRNGRKGRGDLQLQTRQIDSISYHDAV